MYPTRGGCFPKRACCGRIFPYGYIADRPIRIGIPAHDVPDVENPLVACHSITSSGGKGSAGPGSALARDAKRRRAPDGTHLLREIRKMPSVGQRRPALPRAYPAVPSALGGLTSGFGMGPGVPPLPWSLTNVGHSAFRAVPWGPHSATSPDDPIPRPDLG